jgi:5-methylcytosine-specific restriction enzyme subunit McrC
LHRDLHGVDEIALNSHSFRRVQLHANNRFYRFLLNVCELIHGSWLPDKQTGSYRFRDFVRDERAMAQVFQNFLYNFIRIEIPSWKAKREHIKWRAKSETDPSLALLPGMETDISLQRGMHHLIIDAKYYQNTLTQRYETSKLHSANLYQLLTYLSNAERPAGTSLRGMLVYPRVDRPLREQYEIQGFGVTVVTVDLNQPWEKVREEIFGLID